MHRTDSDGYLGVCEITADDGTLMISGPEDETLFRLESSQIAEFRAALDGAIAVAEADLRAHAASRRMPATG